MLEEMMKRHKEHKSNRIDLPEDSQRLKKKGKIKLKPKNSADDILHHLSSKISTNKSFSSSDISIKSSMLPYMDSYFRIQESMQINDSLSRITRENDLPTPSFSIKYSNQSSKNLSNTNETKSTPFDSYNLPQSQSRKRINRHISSEYLKKRYSRLFACLKLQDFDLSNVLYRSDNWLIHFMEECYDDAISCCDKSVNSVKIKSSSNRLDLGEICGR